MITSNTSISIVLILSIISSIGTLVAISNTIRKQRDTEADRRLDIEKNFVKLNIKIDGFCEDTKTMLMKMEKTEEKMIDFNTRLTSVEEQTHTLFKYKDDHEERIKDLEHTS